MSLLDAVGAWVSRVLGVLPPDAAHVLYIPVLFAVVCAGTAIFVRVALLPLTHLGVWLLRCAVTLVGAVILLAEMGTASWYRRSAKRPPAAVYNAGDAVASWISAISERSPGIATVAARVARVRMSAILGFALACFWLWNYRHCPDGAAPAGCVRPVSSWLTEVGGS